MVSQGLAWKSKTHFDSIWFQAFLSPRWTNKTHSQIISCIIYLNRQRFWHNSQIQCLNRQRIHYFDKQYCMVLKLLLMQSWFALHLSSFFAQDQQARVSSFLWTEEFLPRTSLQLKAQRRRITWSISSHLHLFANMQIEQSNTKISRLVLVICLQNLVVLVICLQLPLPRLVY